MPHVPPRHCFIHAYFYLGTGDVVCQFTEGQIYEWHAVGAVPWAVFKADAAKGHDWNLSLIAFFRGFDASTRLNSIPVGFTDSF